LRKEYVEKKTAQLRNDVSEKDKEIAELKAKIVEMETNPQIDPMKLDINIERFFYSRKSDPFSSYGPYTEFLRRESVFEPRCVNFKLDESLSKQIYRIGNMIMKRDRQIHETEVKNMAENLLESYNRDFRNKPKNDLIEKIMNMGWIERMKYFNRFRKARKNNEHFYA
jgi:chaperonin cofactor prefoldin